MSSELFLAKGVCQKEEFEDERKVLRHQRNEDRAIRLLRSKLITHRHKLLAVAKNEATSASLPWLSNTRYSCLLLTRQM